MTLGAYRGGNRLPWLPGATIDTWVPCARGELATGVPQPHVYFIQTIGDRTADSGSIHCPTCRVELAARRAAGISVVTPMSTQSALPVPSSSAASTEAQAALPF